MRWTPGVRNGAGRRGRRGVASRFRTPRRERLPPGKPPWRGRDVTRCNAVTRCDMAWQEILGKRNRLTTWLERHNLDGVLLKRRAHFAWLTAGGDNRSADATA